MRDREREREGEREKQRETERKKETERERDKRQRERSQKHNIKDTQEIEILNTAATCMFSLSLSAPHLAGLTINEVLGKGAGSSSWRNVLHNGKTDLLLYSIGVTL